ncbi:hypothetical protein BBW65_03960 [Helicobacter enhydrae]|uniref:3-oxoacyl-ACP synthase n=1 Tax=Helicobacter enhydrae TaxID=222136 RepID=A0A1B1U5N5_9HELI|nr:hypothetical protein BBW65_03960 [Helicobacter enhydrae]
MKTIFHSGAIQSIACCIPSNAVKLEDQAQQFYNGDIKKAQRIKKSIGLDTRYIADNQTTTLDLCFQASKTLLKTSNAPIDVLIFVTQTPDFSQPNNAHLLHGKLNLSQNCACFDLNQGCSGYVYGLFLAFMLLSSGAENILLCVGDTMSKVLHPNDSNTTPIFGDAGSATLISNTNAKSYFTLHSDGAGWENIIVPNSGFRKNPYLSKNYQYPSFLCMDGAEVFNFSIEKEPKAIEEILQFSQNKIEDIDYIFFHQANAYIISNIARRLELDVSKAPSECVGKYGNTSSASIPLAICDLLSQKREKNLRVILSGFGVGLSWATALIHLDKHTQIFHPIFYNKELE